MKYSEFKKLMEDMGFFTEDFKDCVYVHTLNYLPVAVVFRKYEGLIDLSWDSYIELPVETRKFIADKCMELSFTPPKDREEEEKYYYRLKGFGEEGYLNQEVADIYLSDSSQIIDCQTQFTDKEFAALPDDIKSHNWEKIKVEREE